MTLGMTPEPVLRVEDLRISFLIDGQMCTVVHDVAFELRSGETLGIVGESGSGKSVSLMGILGLLPSGVVVARQGTVHFNGRDLLAATPKEMRALLGKHIGVVFQDPLTSLHPAHRIGDQIAEVMLTHDPSIEPGAAQQRAIELLGEVGIPMPARRAREYPHELSGGMRQRVMIAIAIANVPDVLIADEPTTSLDVTVQAQVIEVLQSIQERSGTAIIFVSHNLGLISEIADRVAVMYAGRMIETGTVGEVFNQPLHPYTVGLIESMPRLTGETGRLGTIAGQPPSPAAIGPGCAFEPRCFLSNGRTPCRDSQPSLVGGMNTEHRSRCHYSLELT